MSYSPLYRGNSARAPSRALSRSYLNGSGSDLIQCTPVSLNGLSQATSIDVSDVDSVDRFLGLLTTDLPMAATGLVSDAGSIEDISLGFAVGDAIYVSKSGFLTNVKPDYGVGGFGEGDFVIFVGIVVKNEFDSLKKDLKLFLSVIGRL